MIKIIFEDIKSANIKIIDNIYDAHGTETYGTLTAYIADNAVGTVDYTIEEADKVFYIRMINVLSEYRHNGIATQLCNYIKNNYSSYSTDWGYTTSDGTYLKNKLTKDVPNEVYNKLKQKITDIQNRLDEIESIVNTDNEEEFEKLQQQGLIDKYSDEWNTLYDIQREYIDKIEDLQPYKTIWK